MGVSHIKLNKRAAQSLLRIAIVGFENQARGAIDLFFMQHQKDFALMVPEQADVLLIDMEHPASKSVLEQYRGIRPFVAVTATEVEFDAAVTLRKPLDGKRLMQALREAHQHFVPPGEQQDSQDSVSNEGEKAFQAYQKRIAAGRQAMSEYHNAAVERDTRSDVVQQRFAAASATDAESQLEEIELQPVENDTQEPVIEIKAAATPRQPEADDSVKQAAPAAQPLQQNKPRQKKPQEVKARLSYQMVYECCGNAPDIDMYDPDQRRRMFFKEDSTLLAIMQEVIAEGEAQGVPVEITGLPGTLAYLPASRQILFDFNEDLFIPLALTRFGYQELTLRVRTDLDAEKPRIGSGKVMFTDYDQLIWKLALWTSKGRLNKVLDPEKPHRLDRELDFERLLAIPHASTISSLWGRHSLSALEVVKVLKISQRYVFSFMTAAHALGAFK